MDIDRQLAQAASQAWLALGKDAETNLTQGLATLARAGLGFPDSPAQPSDWREVAVIAEALSRAGASFGFVMSWLLQVLIARHYLLGHASDRQIATYLPGILNAQGLGAIATSEPKVGADPKRLATQARRSADDFIIDGDKAFITNGPLAQFFIVLAITGEADGRRLFSAFLVDRKAAGLTVTQAADMPLLAPAQHGGLSLRHVRVPAAAMLGAPGQAFDRLAKPFRLLEDALGFAIVTGVLRRMLDLVLQDLRALASLPGDAVLERLGRLEALAELLSRETRALASALNDTPERHLLMPRMIGLRSLVQLLTGELETLLSADPRLVQGRRSWQPIKALLNFAHRGASQEARRLGIQILNA